MKYSNCCILFNLLLANIVFTVFDCGLSSGEEIAAHFVGEYDATANQKVCRFKQASTARPFIDTAGSGENRADRASRRTCPKIDGPLHKRKSEAAVNIFITHWVSNESVQQRRDLSRAINSGKLDRQRLEEKYGRVWNTAELQQEFRAEGFLNPFVIVRRKCDGRLGRLTFTQSPRFYFNFQLL